MFTMLRRLFWLAGSVVALSWVVLTTSAYAQVLPPDVPQPSPGSPGGPSVATEVRWMLTGAGLVLVVAAAVWLLAAGYRRYRNAPRLRTP